MIIACSTSAFKSNLDDALGQIKSMGFKHVDLIAIPGWNQIDLDKLTREYDAYSCEIESLLKKHELTPVAMNMAVGNLYQRNDEENTKRMSRMRSAAGLMNKLNIKIASFYPGYKVDEKDWDNALLEEIKTIKEMMDIGNEFGVTFAVEFHYDTIIQTIEQCRKLLSVLPELQAAYDPSHFAMQEGFSLRDTEEFINKAVHIHMRDASVGKMQEPYGRGTVDFDWIMGCLKKRNYQGAVSIEYLPGLEGNMKEQITALKNKLESLAG